MMWMDETERRKLLKDPSFQVFTKLLDTGKIESASYWTALLLDPLNSKQRTVNTSPKVKDV